MKRYYISFKSYGLITSLLPILFIANGILYTINRPESNGFLGFVSQFVHIFWFAMGGIALVQVYRIYKKKVYFEINEQKMVYSFLRKSSIHEYSDADFYIAKQSGSSINIYYNSVKSSKKKIIPLNIFNIDSDELLTLLSKYSKKDVFIKNYGEELKLFERIE